MVGRVNTASWYFGARHTHPADRAAGCYGFEVTEQPSEPDWRRRVLLQQPGSMARWLVLV
jgi:hypothetical protein